jgi:hypothetical protein
MSTMEPSHSILNYYYQQVTGLHTDIDGLETPSLLSECLDEDDGQIDVDRYQEYLAL